MSNAIYYPCEALLDQGRYIGDDPIGHSCCNDSVYEFAGHVVCIECKLILEQEPERVSFYEDGSTLESRVAAWKRTVQNMLSSEVV